jgi:terpene synthase-like protein
MVLYTIPRLYCPFPSLAHPCEDEIEHHTNSWLLEFNLVDSIETLTHYKKQRFPSFISRSFPEADFADICNWSDLNALLFILDDRIDGVGMTPDKASFTQFEECFLDVLIQRKKCIPEDGPLLLALSDFWSRMCQRTSTKWQEKFIKDIRDMFAGGMWQLEHLLNGTTPDLEEYFKYRQYFGAAHLSTDVLEVTGHIALPEEVYNHPLIHKLTELARNTICFSNDLFSLSKETMEEHNGGEFNLVIVLQRKFNLTIDQAIARTASIHDNLVAEFIDLSGRIYVFDDPKNQMVNKYRIALEYLMSGNIYWSTKVTSRYPHIYNQL